MILFVPQHSIYICLMNVPVANFAEFSAQSSRMWLLGEEKKNYTPLFHLIITDIIKNHKKALEDMYVYFYMIIYSSIVNQSVNFRELPCIQCIIPFVLLSYVN